MGLLLVSGFVMLFGAPYLPTMKKQQQDALDLLALKPGQVVYDLGCGDGRFLITAAQCGLKAVGYELNPFIFIIAWIATLRYRAQVKVRLGNYWHKDLSKADGIFVFLIDKYMAKLDQKITSEITKPINLVSHAFKIPGKKPAKKTGAMLLYEYKPTRT